MGQEMTAQEPLTPPDCDLTDFKFMPLEVARLKKSKEWRAGRKKPEIAFYSINLWCASWHEIPAASLEDDDEVLAELAMCDEKRWPKVKAEVMRKWIKCSDGRLYHPIVAEKANESWGSKLKQRKRTEVARQKKLQGSHRVATETVTSSVTSSVTDSVTDTVTASKGSISIREGKGRERTDAVTELNGMALRVLNDVEPFLNSPTPMTGASIRPWLQAGASPELIIETIRDRTTRRRAREPDWTPSGLGYFDKAVREELAKAEASQPVKSTPEGRRKLLETYATIVKAGRRVEAMTEPDLAEMLALGLVDETDVQRMRGAA
jgi:hypothetical protein